MHKTKAGSSNILYSNSCVLEAEQRNETKRYATHKHTHAHTATATATERERKRHHCMLYAICAIADYRRRESKRHLFVVDSLDKHMQNEKERRELPEPGARNFACGANYLLPCTRGGSILPAAQSTRTSAKLRIKSEKADALAIGFDLAQWLRPY
jgi:undecaprenyl pyrophosphate synthase